ncbi:MAG: hypothetical protein L3K14_09310 [Thermoplasmata archaeon]|nr:hypothetical protein [Thermoplasmata archaeon]
MRRFSWRSATVALLGLLSLLWLVLTLAALIGSLTGGDPLYTAIPGGLVLASLTLFGKVYIVSSILMPFVVIGAISFA